MTTSFLIGLFYPTISNITTTSTTLVNIADSNITSVSTVSSSVGLKVATLKDITTTSTFIATGANENSIDEFGEGGGGDNISTQSWFYS